MPTLVDRYGNDVVGVVSCFDWIVVQGTLPDICYKEAIERFLRVRGVRLQDMPRFFEPMKAELMAHARAIAAEHGLTIEYIAKKNVRKEDRIKEILKQRGSHPGLVHIFSGIEACNTFRPRGRRADAVVFLAPHAAKCLHYYFYFIDADFGLCFLRIPAWAPFRLQCYCNGHAWLAAQLTRAHVPFTLVDNAFVAIDNVAVAQTLADAFSAKVLHEKLDELVRRYFPLIRHFQAGYHWSVVQLEYATDIIFRSVDSLCALYDYLVRTAVHAVKAEHVATFLGRPLCSSFEGEVGNHFHTRIEGTRIKHHMGHASIKMYDKCGRVLRIETTANDVSFFKHHREVEHRDGSRSLKIAPVKKTIYSLPAMATLMAAANRRYLEFISALDDPSDGTRHLLKIAQPTRKSGRSHRGFNLFCAADLKLFVAIARGEFLIHGMRNKHLQRLLGANGRQVSRMLTRLRLHGLIKIVGHTYKYYLTRLGKALLACALKLHENLVIPTLSAHPTATT